MFGNRCSRVRAFAVGRAACPRGAVTAALLMAGAAACGPSEEVQRQLAELSSSNAQKDSLLVTVAENTRLMSEISAEIARVQAPATDAAAMEAPVEVTRERLLSGIQEITTRLEQSETRLRESEQRIETMSKENATLQSSVSTFRKTVADMRATLDNQKQTIASLTDQVESLREENTKLTTENVTLTEERTALADTLVEVERRNATVYYVVGTKEELLQRGLVTEEGGSRVLFVFGKRGKTLVPARDLDPAAFTAIDRRDVTEIPLPWADRPYRIVSRQDVTALETPPDEDNEVRGVLRITDPERFWGTSRYLIIVELK